MRLLRLRSVDRCMTYKFGVLGLRIIGAKAAVRTPGPGMDRAEYFGRYLNEIAGLVENQIFTTGPDLGTVEADFAPLRAKTTEPGAMQQQANGVPFEEIVTGYGLVAAADTALGSLEGRGFAIEGFGKVGGGVALEAARRGGRVHAVSTVHGCIRSAAGFDVATLWDLRREYGDLFVCHVGAEVSPPAALFATESDVLVPGARPGSIGADKARQIKAAHIIPAANAPYSAEALGILRARGVVPHADFLTNSGGAIGYNHPQARHAKTIGELTRVLDRFMDDAVRETLDHPDGPYAGACAIAERFVASWRGDHRVPGEPPLAGSPARWEVAPL